MAFLNRIFPPRLVHAFVRRALLLAAFVWVPAMATAAGTVMVFGDSLSAAYNLSPAEGWVHLIEERIARSQPGWRVVNASISGETTAGGLARLAEDLKRHKPSVVVIELGANDALRGLPVAGMRSNLEKMIRLVREARAQPVLVGIMIPPNYGIDYAAQFRDLYPAIAARDKLALVPFLLEGIDKPELFQRDQMHPVAAAQPRIADNVWAVLGPVLRKAKP
jgi:acyl-CoA thioesterase-1